MGAEVASTHWAEWDRNPVWPQGQRRRAPGTWICSCLREKFSLSTNFKGTILGTSSLPWGSLAQEISGEAPLLFSSPLSGTFSFSSAPETTHKGSPSGNSCGSNMGSAQTLGQKQGRREATEVRLEGVKSGRGKTNRA